MNFALFFNSPFQICSLSDKDFSSILLLEGYGLLERNVYHRIIFVSKSFVFLQFYVNDNIFFSS